MEIKNEVLVRVYILLFGIVVPIAIILLTKTVVISVVEGEKWRELGKNNYVKYKSIEPDRGNIISADGSVLATSIPYFDIYFDPQSPRYEDYMANIDSLAYCLATYVDQSYTVGGYKQRLLDLRADTTNRYVPIKKQVSYSEKRQIEKFPLFNLGQFRGGFIAERRSERRLPFGILAQRTIGYIREGIQPVGLEGYFDEYLSGEPGTQFMICVDTKRDLWMPVEDLMSIDPESGDDIQTTLDVNLQDIVENALLEGVRRHEASWGTAILMEVKTGQIKAIANLDSYRDGYWERYNHAVGSAIEPGSTFKLASILALLEDRYIRLNDPVFINRGKWTYYDRDMEDAVRESFGIDTTTVRRAFEISSNVGISRLVTKYYGERTAQNNQEGAERFIKRLKQFNLNLPTGIEIEGEGAPLIKEAYSDADNWSGTTLPWMSIGYELQLTPLQLLAFYNAVANDGQMMKPYLVSEVQRFGEQIKIFKPKVIKKEIASPQAIAAAKELLQGVVEDGTARDLKTPDFDFAGKTGTAQIRYRRLENSRRVGGYQASFVGYFPAEDPMYSCIVVINNPTQNGRYGGEVAGPIFKKIAEQCFSARVQLHEPINVGRPVAVTGRKLPGFDLGDRRDLEYVLDFLQLPVNGAPETEIAEIRSGADTLAFANRQLPKDKVPVVTGMGLKDALYVLENRGLKVKVEGYGKVARQSLKAGTPIRGQSIVLYLQ